MNDRLKNAVRTIEAPAYLETRIKANLQAVQAPAPRALWARPWAVAAAAAVLFVAGTIAYELGHLRLTTSSQESYIAKVTMQVGTLMRVGLGDHVHCAVFRKYPKNPPKVEELEATLGPEYAGLIPIIRGKVQGDYRLMIGHECRYHDRKFVHLSMQGEGRLLSVVIARKGEGESFKTEQLVPALASAGIPVYQAGVQRFELAAFESRDHLVYVISDMPKDRNTELMIALAPQVKALLQKLEL